MELLRRFRGEPDSECGDHPRRTVAELLDAAAERRHERERQAAAAHAAEQARRERERALAREKRLDALARDQESAWAHIDTMISTRKPAEYDTAVELLKDLRALAQQADHIPEFARRLTLLRQDHQRKPSLVQRLDRAGLTDQSTT